MHACIPQPVPQLLVIDCGSWHSLLLIAPCKLAKHDSETQSKIDLCPLFRLAHAPWDRFPVAGALTASSTCSSLFRQATEEGWDRKLCNKAQPKQPLMHERTITIPLMSVEDTEKQLSSDNSTSQSTRGIRTQRHTPHISCCLTCLSRNIGLTTRSASKPSAIWPLVAFIPVAMAGAALHHSDISCNLALVLLAVFSL